MKKYLQFCVLNVIILVFSINVNAQLIYDLNANANTLVQKLMNNACVTFSNAKYIGANGAKAMIVGGTNPMGINNGIILTTGNASGADATPPYPQTYSITNNMSGDADLDVLASPNVTYDASVLEFDFVPLADSIFFKYLFGSEEYHDGFDSYTAFDLFAFFISGPGITGLKNVAEIPETLIEVGRGTINRTVNTQYFHDNNMRTQNAYRGWTSVFRSGIKLQIGQTYHAKLVIADVTDNTIDSGVLIETIECPPPAPLPPVFTVSTSSSNNPNTPQNSFYEGCENIIIKVKANKKLTVATTVSIALSGTATNGSDYSANATSVTIPIGSDSAIFTLTILSDNSTESDETINVDFNPSSLSIPPIIGLIIKDVTPIQIDLTSDYTICQGSTINISPSISGGRPDYTYVWENGKTTESISESPNIETTYKLTVTDACNNTNTAQTVVNIEIGSAEAGDDQSICFGKSATLTSTPASSYIWSNGGITQSITVSPNQTTKYYLSATSNCMAVDSVIVTVYPIMPVNIITSKNTICLGIETNMSSNATANTYFWSSIPNDTSLTNQNTKSSVIAKPTISTIYSLMITDFNGCSNTTSIKINIDNGPSASFRFSAPKGCVSSPIDITSNTTGNYIYLWNFGYGRLISGNNGASNKVAWDSLGFMKVSLQIKSENGCLGDIITDSIEIFDIPMIDFYAIDTAGCPPLVVLFNNDSLNQYPDAEYYWEFGDKGTSSDKTPVHLYKNSGKFSVSLKITNAGCSNSETKNNIINVYPVPKSEFVVKPEETSIFYPDVVFYDVTKNADSTTWYLLWNDSTFGNTPKFEYEFPDTGVQQFYLIAINSFGCIDSGLGEVLIKEDFTLYRPKCFTPNEDGLNDVFDIKGIGIIEFKLTIYNRWGEIIYYSEDLNEKWNGKLKNTGKLVQTGIYPYRIEFKNSLLKRSTIFGHVMVLYKK